MRVTEKKIAADEVPSDAKLAFEHEGCTWVVCLLDLAAHTKLDFAALAQYKRVFVKCAKPGVGKSDAS